MQYKTNYLALFILALFAGGVGYFIYVQAKRDPMNTIAITPIQADATAQRGK